MKSWNLTNAGRSACAGLLTCLLATAWLADSAQAASLPETAATQAIGAELQKGAATSGLAAKKRAESVAAKASAQNRSLGDLLGSVLQPTTSDTPGTISLQQGGVEEGKTLDVFKDTTVVRRWLGDEPQFVYRAHNRPDPMLIPWLADEYKASITNANAELLWKKGGKENQEIALQLWTAIITSYDSTEVAATVNAFLPEKQREFDEAYGEEGPDVPKRVEFPKQIATEFSAIIFTDKVSEHRIMIDDVIYKVGDTVRGGDHNNPVKLKGVKRLPNNRRQGYAVFGFNDLEYKFALGGETVAGMPNPK
ncbi:hypothetical protein ACFL34_03550 [Candidatus Sumerlaeota bacterium]